MKQKLTFRLGVVCAIAILASTAIFFSCQKGNSNSSNSPTKIVLTQPGKLSDGTILPTGTEISTIPGNVHSLMIQLPAGYQYVGYEITSGATTVATAQAVSLSSFSVTCTCNAGSGCSPFSAPGGNVGCSTNGSCTKCTLETGHGFGGTTSIANGVIVHQEETHFVTTRAELNSLKSASPAMFTLPAVKREVDKLTGFIDTKDIDAIKAGLIPAGYQYLPVSLYGRLVVALVKKSMTPASDPAINEVAGMAFTTAATKCTCNSGQSGCVAGSAGFGQVHFCSAGACTSCTLSQQ
jgi:hypothetical protein